VVTDGEVLLIKDWFGSGQWSVPGGGLHRGEAAIDGAVRELREEVGITTTAEQLRLLTPKLVRVKTGRVEFDCMAYQLRLKVKPVIHRQWYEIAETQWRPLADLGGNQADGGLTSLLEALGGTDSLLH
jgi:8-oxo-dGTP pyrophosphatase MutT (NUDIX family)